MSQENVDLTHQAYDAVNRRDLGALLRLMDADVEAVPALVRMEGDYHGRAGIRRWWENLLDVFPDFVIEVGEVRDLGDLALGTLRIRGHGAIAKRRSTRRSGWQRGGGAGGAFVGLPTEPKPRPSKPWGWRSRRCRRRMPPQSDVPTSYGTSPVRRLWSNRFGPRMRSIARGPAGPTLASIAVVPPRSSACRA
jgi:ketosteroid isomerase-like protein